MEAERGFGRRTSRGVVEGVLIPASASTFLNVLAVVIAEGEDLVERIGAVLGLRIS